MCDTIAHKHPPICFWEGDECGVITPLSDSQIIGVSCKPISVYRILPTCATANTHSSLDSVVISVFDKLSNTSNIKTIKSPPSGMHVVIYNVG